MQLFAVNSDLIRTFLMLSSLTCVVESISSDVLRQILANYSLTKVQRAGGETGEKLKVHFDVQVTDIGNIDETNLQYTVTLYLRQRWLDRRLAYASGLFSGGNLLTFYGSQTDSIWLPDTYFVNYKAGHDHRLTAPNRVVEIATDGSISYSQRLTLTLGCAMDLRRYPLDRQLCHIDISSYGYRSRDVQYFWASDRDAMVLSIPEILPEFYVLDDHTRTCSNNYSGPYGTDHSCIRGSIHLHRRFSGHLVRVYVPTTIIVVMSWLNFFISIDFVAARISLCVVMTLTSITMGVNRAAFGFSRASDVWGIVCLFFVSLSFFEIAVCNFLHNRQLTRKKLEELASRPSLQAEAKSSSTLLETTDDDTEPAPLDENAAVSTARVDTVVASEMRKEIIMWRRKAGKLSKKVKLPSSMYWVNWWIRVKKSPSLQLDLACRVIFPVSFMIFVILYVISYCVIVADA